jgi:cystathionine beta-lyase/cystathionine gamma-synthase
MVGNRHRRSRRNCPSRWRAVGGRQHCGDAGFDPAGGARRRYRHAFGDKILERAQRCDWGEPDDGPQGRILGTGLVAARSGGGAILGGFEAYLLLRGMRTLFPRVERACHSAQQIAEALSVHSRIAEVLYPGLPTHPGHAVAARQMTGGFGGMLSVRVAGGTEAAIAAAAKVEVWQRATSLGGVESLIEHRFSVEGADSPAPPDLLRLSVGIEHPADLLADLDDALCL